MPTTLDDIRRFHTELTELRHDIHANPELGLEEHRTADVVAQRLTEWGIEVHRGIGGTGVVGVLRCGNGHGRIGLRADMDALPIEEATGLPYASRNRGAMHACGHDGHTTMLLAVGSVDFRLIFAPLVNHPEHMQEMADVAAELVGERNVDRNKPPAVASEDFSFMLEQVPGAYINIGNGEESAPVHNPQYDFNDEAIPYGSALFARLVERKLARETER